MYWRVTGSSSNSGVVQPFDKLYWWKWMYRILYFTYFIEGILGHGNFRIVLASMLSLGSQ